MAPGVVARGAFQFFPDLGVVLKRPELAGTGFSLGAPEAFPMEVTYDGQPEIEIEYEGESPGVYFAPVRFTFGDCGCVQRIVWAVGHTAAPDLDAVPAGIDIGAVPVGVVRGGEVTLVGEGGAVEVWGVEVDDPRFFIDTLPELPTMLGLGEALSVGVSYLAQDAEPVAASLVIQHSHGEVVVTVRANAIEGAGADEDGDGFTVFEGDCDDANAQIHPGLDEILDGIDQDCDGAVDEHAADRDLDGFTEVEGDCDDLEPAAVPDSPLPWEDLCGDPALAPPVEDPDCDEKPPEDWENGCAQGSSGTSMVGGLIAAVAAMVRRRKRGAM